MELGLEHSVLRRWSYSLRKVPYLQDLISLHLIAKVEFDRGPCKKLLYEAISDEDCPKKCPKMVFMKISNVVKRRKYKAISPERVLSALNDWRPTRDRAKYPYVAKVTTCV